MEYQYGQNNENGRDQGSNDYIYYNHNFQGNDQIPSPKKRKEKKRTGGMIALCIVLSLVMGTAGGALGSSLVMGQYNKKEAAREAEAETGTKQEKDLSQKTDGGSRINR